MAVCGIIVPAADLVSAGIVGLRIHTDTMERPVPYLQPRAQPLQNRSPDLGTNQSNSKRYVPKTGRGP